MSHAFNRELDRHLAQLNIAPEARRIIDEQRVMLAVAELPSNINERRYNICFVEAADQHTAAAKRRTNGRPWHKVLLALLIEPAPAQDY
jgi:hypothetical protein